MLCHGPLTLTVNAERCRSTTSRSFVATRRAATKPLFYATLGPGSVTHLYGIIMSQSMGFAVTDIAYRNNPASIMDMLSGECDLNFATPAAVIEHVKGGQAEDPGAVLAASALPQLPDIPTFAESGYPELTASFWTALHAPAGTPPDIIAKLNDGCQQGAEDAGDRQADGDRNAAGRNRDRRRCSTASSPRMSRCGGR